MYVRTYIFVLNKYQHFECSNLYNWKFRVKRPGLCRG